MPSVLAVDPGRTTGYCLWENGNRIEGEIAGERFLDFAAQLIENGKVDFVVCERFIISAQTGKFSQAPWSLEQIGVLRFLCKKYDVSFILQNVADAKKFCTDERLNSINWRRPPGAGHARDAQRHALLFIVKQKFIDNRIFLEGSS